MAFIRQKGIPTLTHSVKIHPEHIEAGYNQGGESNYRRVVVLRKEIRTIDHNPYHTEDKHHSCGQGSRVAHEDFLLLGCVAKDIIVEEGEEGACRGGGQHREDIFPPYKKDNCIKSQGYRAQTGGETVDTVD